MIGVLIMSLALFSGVVYAFLASATPVLSCSDSDGGFVLGTQGIVFVQHLSTQYQTYIDQCGGARDIIEYECRINATGTFLAEWHEFCSAGTTCSNGACT